MAYISVNFFLKALGAAVFPYLNNNCNYSSDHCLNFELTGTEAIAGHKTIIVSDASAPLSIPEVTGYLGIHLCKRITTCHYGCLQTSWQVMAYLL